jgi:hypothetical protein
LTGTGTEKLFGEIVKSNRNNTSRLPIGGRFYEALEVKGTVKRGGIAGVKERATFSRAKYIFWGLVFGFIFMQA